MLVEPLEAQVIGLLAEKLGQGGAFGELEVYLGLVLDGRY